MCLMAEADGKSSPGTAKILRIIARVIGIVVMMFFLALLIGDGVQSIHNEGFHGISAESL